MNKENLFAMVAEKKLQIKTLATRHSDELDFHDVAVWQVREAFEQIWRVREDEVRSLRKRIATLEIEIRKKQKAGLL